MGEINRRMTRYVAQQLNLSDQAASDLRQHYWHRYGATLLGMTAHHGVDPHDFLAQTHPHHDLAAFVRRARGGRLRIKRLSGVKWLVTNAPRAYAEQVLKLLGLRASFDRLIAIEDMVLCGRFRPKPSSLLMRQLLRASRRPAHEVRLIDDHDDNLRTAHRLGIRTARVWASKTALSQARHSGRPLAIRRPSYVRLQVHSMASLLQSQRAL